MPSIAATARLDTYISKSEVEALSTDPAGKVLPILNHARNTEVFAQFTQLARDVMDDFCATAAPRSQLFHEWLIREEEKAAAALAARRDSLRSDCLLCRQPYPAADRSATISNPPTGRPAVFWRNPASPSCSSPPSSIWAPDCPPMIRVAHAPGGDQGLVVRVPVPRQWHGGMVEFSRFDGQANNC